MGSCSCAGYEALIRLPYSLPKLDLVGIPDFSAGAMENWGIVTFRETDLLVKGEPEVGTRVAGLAPAPAEAAVGQLHRVPSVVAHELAHACYFGALPATLLVRMSVLLYYVSPMWMLACVTFWHACARSAPPSFCPFCALRSLNSACTGKGLLVNWSSDNSHTWSPLTQYDSGGPYDLPCACVASYVLVRVSRYAVTALLLQLARSLQYCTLDAVSNVASAADQDVQIAQPCCT